MFVIHSCVALPSNFTVSTPPSGSFPPPFPQQARFLFFSYFSPLLSLFFLAPFSFFRFPFPSTTIYNENRRRSFCTAILLSLFSSQFQLGFLCRSCSVRLNFKSMELVDYCSSSTKSKKRKTIEQGDVDSFIDELNQDLLERVLSWLPTSSLFRLSSVCKRWKSVASSPSFKLACSEIPSRDPWFFMVDPHINQSVVFDSTERAWKKLNHLQLLSENTHKNSLPVAASGGLICFLNPSGNFIISNPLTQSCLELPSPPHLDVQNLSLHAIVMKSISSGLNQRSYRLVLVHGQFPSLWFKIYNSTTNCWEEDVLLSRKTDESVELSSSGDNALYFLSKAGNLISTNMERSPSKQYSSVITTENGEDIVYFIGFSGTIVSCNLTRRCFTEFPRLLPVFSEYSIDVVECKGEILVVMLSEFLESATLRVWKFDKLGRIWQQIAAMPPAMSNGWFGKRVDINCIGAGGQIFICANSAEPEICSYLLCDVVRNQWVDLPKCCVNGVAMEFMSAFAFEPRIEASVSG